MFSTNNATSFLSKSQQDTADVRMVTLLSSNKWAIKGKVVPLRSTEAHLGERRYSSYSFLTSALGGGERSASRPGRPLFPGKEPPVPIVQEAGWAAEPVWTERLVEKPSASVGGRTPAVQSVVRHRTDWATPAPHKWTILFDINRLLQGTISTSEVMRRWMRRGRLSFGMLHRVGRQNLTDFSMKLTDTYLRKRLSVSTPLHPRRQ
jgi:hypothetical protein